ncbi:Zn(II)2Cys6 transcription factor [Aspergillus alliaceus]|uniref:Zn(II)2Cys6 transcription factor n=1 Tax=Petromyces alliaceus TaxID=209559 RepID=UPI0012A677CC|nr:C6 transcription factor [Aspergillus alliaceus]KAB8235430.1 C6 transcription factor [Aspergillus alliaceus]
MSARRHRSAVACQHCRQRKVRCSFTVTGVPCIGCTQDGTECVIPQGKAQTPRIRQPAPQINQLGPETSPRVAEDFRRSMPPRPSGPVDAFTLARIAPQIERPKSVGDVVDTNPSPDDNRSLDEERTGAEIATTALGRNRRAGQAPFYTGESPGFGSVLDLCSPPQQPVQRHILLQPKTSIPLSAEDRDYLQYKGVFNMPRSDTCDELLRAYFHHVHPIFPVVDATTFLKTYPSGESNQCNLLLLWSMLFVAANYISVDTWKREGYSSRKEMKDTLYSRAKCMYHNSGETDNTVLLQSALLLGFYHSEVDMHMQPWYWTGTAISLCQIMGLHRCPVSAWSNSSIPESQQRLWRRLWWTCFFRDRWLSLTMGRPLRIDLNDCDTVLPSSDDMLNDLIGLPESVANVYIPTDLPRLADCWVTMIHLSKLLGDVLTLSYRPFGPYPSLQQVEAIEAEIRHIQFPNNYRTDPSRLATFYLYHLQLHYQSLLITFYRPFITKIPEGLPAVQQQAWQSQIRNKLDAAALQTNSILDNLAREKLLEFAGPMTPPLLVPAMHVHLLNCKSSDGLSRRLGLNKLELCMVILEQMQHTHPSCSVFRGIFLGAIRQIFPDYMARPSMPETTPAEYHIPQDAPFDDPALGMVISDDVIGALMNEGSIYNFWETLNWM